MKYVIMEKRLQFLKYILDESMHSMISQVHHEQKKDSKKGDFVKIVTKNLAEVEIKIKDDEIKKMSKGTWKRLCKMKTKNKAFVELVKENGQKEKSKHIKFDCLKMSEYLKENKKTQLLKFSFSLRSRTPTSIVCVYLDCWIYCPRPPPFGQCPT